MSKYHVHMILKIQKAFRMIKYNNYQSFMITNWWHAIRPVMVYTVFAILIPKFSMIIHFVSLMYFDVSILYGIFIGGLLQDGIATWMNELEYHSELCLDLDEGEKVKRKLLQAYTTFLEAFSVYKKIFQFGVS